MQAVREADHSGAVEGLHQQCHLCPVSLHSTGLELPPAVLGGDVQDLSASLDSM
jgi:hypothetical protein